MMRLLCAGAAGLLAGSAIAEVVYVTPDGTGPGTQDHPTSLAQAAQRAKAGDRVVLLPGLYRQTATVANSGSAEAPIIFEAQDGAAVTISGAEPITGWKPFRGSIYVADMPGSFFSSAMPGAGKKLFAPEVHNQADQIFADGKMMPIARWPNSPTLDPSFPAKSVTDAFISKTRSADNWTTGVIEDNEIESLDPALLANAEIFFQPNSVQAWSWTFTGRVTAKEGKRLTFVSRSDSGEDFHQHRYHANSRYFLFNTLGLLDAPGEWYHDKEAGKLYLWMPDGSSPEGRVEAKKREFGFDLTGRSHVTIRNLKLFACTITTDNGSGGDNVPYDDAGQVRYPWRNAGLNRPAEPFHNPPYNDAPSTGCVLERLEVLYPTHYTDVSGHFNNQWGQSSGIVLSGTGHVLRQSRIRYSAGNLVSLLGRGHRVYDNELTDANYMATSCAAVHTGSTHRGSSDHEIAWNTIARTGKSGLMMSCFYRSDVIDGSDWKGRVHHNDVSQFAIQDADSGGLYTGGDLRFVRIDHNHFHDAHPNVDSIPGAGNFTVGGVYPDFGRNLIIDHNVIWNVEWAIHLQAQAGDTANILVYNNTCAVKRLAPSVGYGPFGVIKNSGVKHAGTLVQNNIFYSLDGVPGYKPSDFDTDAALDRVVQSNLSWDGKKGTDPLFLNPTASDFRLQPSSPARDAGQVIEPLQRDGIRVPAFNNPVSGNAVDIGAYEVGGEDHRVGVRGR